MTRKTGFVLIVIGFAAALAAIGYWMLFSSFAVYDDEGYILISVREYFFHGKLYEGVYSQYGPVFYFLMDLLQRGLGQPVDHTLARWLTLGFWIGTAGCCALTVWRQTTSRSLTVFTLTATFLYLYFITDEPFHPGSLIFFVLAASLCISTQFISAGKWSASAAVAGGTAAILILTKINVGAFYTAAVVAWAVGHATSPRVRRFSTPMLIIGLTALAVALMDALLREAWVQIYLILFSTGAIGLILATKGETVITTRPMGWFFVAGLTSATVELASIWLRGTSFPGLIDGVLLGPLRHPGNYSYPVDWRPGSLLIAVVSVALACAHPFLKRRYSPELTDRLIVALRLVVGTALLAGIALLMNFRAVGAIFSYVAPLIWIWVIPLSSLTPNRHERAGRTLLATVLLLQYLHAYPVGGAQESWGTFLFIPLVALGLGDVRRWLALRSASTGTANPCWVAVGLVFTFVVSAKTGWIVLRAHRDYHARSGLNLPGAAQLHLPESQRVSYRILALNAVVHTDMLFSLPGMFSFNLWTGLPTPTGKNTTLWFTLLNEAEQRAIIRKLEASPRPGLIVQDSLVELMEANEIPMKGVLWDYLHSDFQAIFRSDGFAFWTKKGRSLAGLNIATLRVLSTPDPTGQKRNTQLEFCLLHDGTPITAIDIKSGVAEQPVMLHLDARNASLALVAINREGQSSTSLASASWPVTKQGFIRLRVWFDRNDLSLTPSNTILYMRGVDGENLGEVRIDG